MPKTVIEKSPSSSASVTVFSVSGTLGFHEKNTLVKLLNECKKRGINRVVLNVGELSSLGGGCAQILRAEAAAGLIICIAKAKATVVRFLQKQDSDHNLIFAGTIDEAISKAESHAVPAAGAVPSNADYQEVTHNSTKMEEELNEVLDLPVADTDSVLEERVEPAPPAETAPSGPVALEKPGAPASAPADPDARATTKELQKKIVQYNTILSINADLCRITERQSLVDLFLLTTIAQVGVESAAFLEYERGEFLPVAMKGSEPGEFDKMKIAEHLVYQDVWKKTCDVYDVNNAPFDDEVKAEFASIGCSYVAPFIVQGDFKAIVALGKPIRAEMDDTTLEFLKILINQAAIAYENTSRVEEESERTLGLVQMLISLIEENTLARGNTSMLSDYTYSVAQLIHYPEEHVRELMYGTVLRDIGMIKVSDLIVRSPRELMPEEWEIIKRHPLEGAEMLRGMKFSEHTGNVVLCHHERFNGEGYPNGIQGNQIPLGARIVSVVESYAAMLHQRPTRPALSQEEALNTLKENWGMRYDPEVVKHFAHLIEQEIRGGQSTDHAEFKLFSV